MQARNQVIFGHKEIYGELAGLPLVVFIGLRIMRRFESFYA
jgi:hypothetical protein